MTEECSYCNGNYCAAEKSESGEFCSNLALKNEIAQPEGPNEECTKICPQNFKLMIANTSDFNSPVVQEFNRVQSEENSCSVRGRFTGKFINFALTVSFIKLIIKFWYKFSLMKKLYT